MIINLTPHEVVVFLSNNEEIRFPSLGVVRLEEKMTKAGVVDGIEIVKKEFVDCIVNLKEPIKKVEDDVTVIVSSVVLQSGAVADMEEKIKEKIGARSVRLVAPDTGPDSAVRDDRGRIIGVRRFWSL